MQALRVVLTETLAYWTVVGDDWRPVPVADAYLRHLRLGADRAEGTTRTYAGDIACYLSWCQRSGRDLMAGARGLGGVVAGRSTPPPPPPGGRGGPRPRPPGGHPPPAAGRAGAPPTPG